MQTFLTNVMSLLLIGALAQPKPAPQIGVLAVPPPDYGVLDACHYHLSQLGPRGKPVLERTNPHRMRINLDGRDRLLKRSRVVFSRPVRSSLEELRQEVFTGSGFQVVVDYRIRSSNYEGADYQATITAMRGRQRSTLKAEGFYGCPRQ
jgi:hypothetical protein